MSTNKTHTELLVFVHSLMVHSNWDRLMDIEIRGLCVANKKTTTSSLTPIPSSTFEWHPFLVLPWISIVKRNSQSTLYFFNLTFLSFLSKPLIKTPIDFLAKTVAQTYRLCLTNKKKVAVTFALTRTICINFVLGHKLFKYESLRQQKKKLDNSIQPHAEFKKTPINAIISDNDRLLLCFFFRWIKC